MSDTNGTQEKQKAAKVRRKPKHESILRPTFVAARHDVSDTLWDRHQQGSGLLQRQCACGTHTIGGGECDTCRKKHESSFLQRTAITVVPDNTLLNDPAETHTFPKSGFTHDFSQIPAHTTAAPSPVQTKFTLGLVGDQYEQKANQVAKQGAGQINTPVGQSIQRKEVANEDELMTKPRFLMRTFTQKPKAVQQSESAKSLMPDRALSGQNLAASFSIHLQRTIGNQAVQQLLQAKAEDFKASPASSTSTGLTYDFSRIPIHTNAHTHRNIQPKLKIQVRGASGERDINEGVENRLMLAHELAHVVQKGIEPGQGSANRSPLIQRGFINSAGGDPIAFRFHIGVELDTDFVRRARELIDEGLNDVGSIPDESLISLRDHALDRRQTLNDNERMFMAGLLDPANVTTFNRTPEGDPFQFPTTSITRARRDRVNNLGRGRYPSGVSPLIAPALPQSIIDEELAESSAALGHGGPPTERSHRSRRIEALSREAILDTLRDAALSNRARGLLTFIAENSISARETLGAMIQGASDNSQRDRVFAGIVYAIARQANHDAAGWVADGEIKVDALDPDLMAALPGFTAQTQAAYVSEAQSGGVKGDTMYVKTDLDIENTHHRSLVIHEMQHAQDDAAASTTGALPLSNRAQLEARAYRSQARYIYDQLASQEDVNSRTASAIDIADGMAHSQPLNVALVLEGQANPTRNRPLYELINRQAPAAAQITPDQINTAFSTPTARLETMLLTTIYSSYGLSPTSQAPTGGLAGESIMDWINRL